MTDIDWEVSVIEWSEFNEIYKKNEKEQEENGKKAYNWSMDLCKTFEVDLKIKPKIIDYRKENWYQCEFIRENRLFKVSSYLNSRMISLKYIEEYFKKRNDEIEK